MLWNKESVTFLSVAAEDQESGKCPVSSCRVVQHNILETQPHPCSGWSQRETAVTAKGLRTLGRLTFHAVHVSLACSVLSH